MSAIRRFRAGQPDSIRHFFSDCRQFRTVFTMERMNQFGQLIPVGGGDPIPLLKTKLMIGRRSSCDISISFPNVSSHHCELELIEGYWQVRDLHSRNGVKVNGERCEKRWLMPGDVLSVAKHKFEIVYEAVGNAPPPDEADDPFAIGLLEKAGLTNARSSDGELSERYRRGPKPEEWKPKAAEEDPVMKWLSEETPQS